MKNLKTLLIGLVSIVFLFTACEGPSGPPGLDGLNGRDGRDGGAVIFEIAGVDFTQANNYSEFQEIPNDIFIDESDLILVYRQNGEDTNSGDVWQLLPQNFFLDEGTLQYNFNHTRNDVEIVMDSNFDINTISNQSRESFLEDQIFRIAVVPGAFSNQNAKILSDFYEYDVIAKDAKFLNFTE